MMSDEKKIGQGGVAWEDDHHCVVCGSENPMGMKLEFQVVDGKLRTSWVADKRFQGYADVLHGGILATILDEVMVNLPWKRDGIPVISAEMTVRWIKPARIGERLDFESEVDDTSKRMMAAKGRCLNSKGELVAEATAKCVRLKAHNLQVG